MSHIVASVRIAVWATRYQVAVRSSPSSGLSLQSGNHLEDSRGYQNPPVPWLKLDNACISETALGATRRKPGVRKTVAKKTVAKKAVVKKAIAGKAAK